MILVNKPVVEKVEFFKWKYNSSKRKAREALGLQALLMVGTVIVASDTISSTNPWLDVESRPGVVAVVVGLASVCSAICTPLMHAQRVYRERAIEAQLSEIDQAITIGRPVPEYARSAMTTDHINLEVADNIY